MHEKQPHRYSGAAVLCIGYSSSTLFLILNQPRNNAPKNLGLFHTTICISIPLSDFIRIVTN